MAYATPVFVEAYTELSIPPSLEILNELETTAAKALSRAIDCGADTGALATSIDYMKLDIRRLLESIWCVEEAIDTISQALDPDED